ncbi:dienelactone hydrolase family protein [Opitutia bacterium ISCC 51]|nr:dienelactone hydrolase family protein [Opitutae bacterium ISCC 51]QXD27238.1 dienelactone hydrolase family protein [Opitutae bacterium ISCC 52]
MIAISDADQTPEMVAGLAPGLPSKNQFARRLAEQGYEVVVPALISRDDTWSGNESLNYFTNQPHREWIYRQAFEMGRHLMGYELQKILGLVDWYSAGSVGSDLNIGVFGYGEGGMLALYSGALDTRIDSTLVGGYFGKREGLWQEPIYRNVMGLLKEFGDAELAAMMAPRPFMVERGHYDQVAPDEWVAYEYAKVRRLYAELGIPERTDIEFFNGPHTINGEGTFRFLHEHLDWTEPKF